MAVMEQALCSYILSKSEVTSLIGSGSSARLYAIVLPQDCDLVDGPAATYEIITSKDLQTLADRVSIVQSRTRITAYAATHAAATGLARAIKNCGIAALKGISGSVDFRGVVIEEGVRCYVEGPTDGGATWRYIAEFDLMISYLET
jgi:hypothetical protein